MAHIGDVCRIVASDSISQSLQMPWEFLFENGDQVAQKLAIVIDASEQFGEINTGHGSRRSELEFHVFLFVCDLPLHNTVNFGAQNENIDGLGDIAIHSGTKELVSVA